ncbi:MAG: hypothetical protein IKW81_07300 [Pseudobutyrivibrio sp.]|nr:hypothetical protein [Pseudobutyrivibrio sp.]
MKSINEIQKVILTEKGYSFPDFKCMRSENIELTLDGIKYHKTLHGSKKWLNNCKCQVDKEEMKSFFSELYEFVRNAAECGPTDDDCEHMVLFTYNDYHEELFWGWTGDSKESLSGKIWSFVNLHM